MALIIEGGISIGGNITITSEAISPTANLVLFYDAGNSMSYNGSGSIFNTSYTGPTRAGYEQYGVIDLSGVLVGSWNSGYMSSGGDPMTWTSKGVASYWTMNSSQTQYIASDWQQSTALNSPTYTLLAVVRPRDFSAGAIVGGDEQVFAFAPNGGLDDGPTLAAGNGYGPPAVIDTTTVYELDTWYCVAVTYDAGTGEMKLYKNGSLVASATGVNSPTHPTGLYWGTLEAQLWYTGDMAVCMAYERVLGASEITQLSDVYLSRYVPPPATSSVVFDIPYTGGPPTTWTVPEGVYSISVVAVGAGGGGTQDAYAPPGGDTAMLRNDNYVTVDTTYTGTSYTIIVDTTAYPNIANVTGNGTWVVGGANIPGPANGIPAWDLVTSVDTTTSPGNAIITIDQEITTTAGDSFFFYQGVAVAEGGYEINTFFYNQYNSDPGISSPGGPGAQAVPLVTDGPYGAGGVVDWTDEYGIGGGGAGGYGIAGLAWDINRAGSWIHNVDDYANAYHTMSFTNSNLTVNGLIGIGTSKANQECQVLGTQIIPGPKVMYSLVVEQTAGINYTGVGLSNFYEDLQNFTGYSVNSIGYYDDGRVFIDYNAIDTFAPFNEGGVVDIAVDMEQALIWFRVAGGAWNSSGDPAAGTGGVDISALRDAGYPITLAASPWYDDDSSTSDIISIATTAAYSVPAGFTFVPGVPNAGGTGGQGASFYAGNNTNGTGGSGAGGGGKWENTGAGGSGTGLYGRGTNGVAGNFVPYGVPNSTVSTVSTGGSSNGITDSPGGQATPWNGGRGGWPGGAGASSVDYYDGGNGGALAYRNDYEVTPGEEFLILPGLGGPGATAGGSGSNGAVRIVWPGNTRQFPATLVGPDTVSLPTLDITDSSFSGQSGTVTYNITNDGGGEILESGIVWGVLSDHQYSGSVDICDGSSFTEQRAALRDGDGSCGNAITTGQSGEISQTVYVNNFGGESINVYAYARNAAGVAYSPTVLNWDVVPCLAEGTLITLADGTMKAIEDLSISDTLKVWDFDDGVGTTAPVLWLQRQHYTLQYNLCKFSDGSELKTIGQHRIFNKQLGKFTYPMTDDTPVGTITVKADGTEVTLTDKKVIYEGVNYYNLISNYHINCYANGILTSNRFNNTYPITDMRYVKDDRALRNRSEFVGIADRWIDGLRLPEQTIELKALQKRVEAYENNEKQEPTAGRTRSWQ